MISMNMRGILKRYCLLQFGLLCSFIALAVPFPASGQTPLSAETPVSASAEATPPLLRVPSELPLFEDIPVVVTASKKPERVTEAPSIISVITAEDIQRMGARSIVDVLRTIPGIEIVKDAWGISQIAVRGLRTDTSSGVKVLVDGHALNDPLTGGATELYDDLTLKNVQRIEIIRGPASSIYGANAFVSVVNIITKDVQDIHGIELSLGAGSFDTFNPSLLIGKTFNGFEVSLYADYYTTDGAKLSVETDWASLYDDSSPEVIPPISLAPGTFQEEREKLEVAYKLKYWNFTLHGRFLDKRWGPFLTDWYVLNTDSFEEVRHGYTALEYQRFFTQRIEVIGKIYADYFDGKRFENVAPGIMDLCPPTYDEFYVYPNGLKWEYKLKSWRLGGECQVNYRLLKNNDLTVGIAYEYEAIDDFRLFTNEQNCELGRPPDKLYDLSELFPDVKTSSYQYSASIFAQDKWKVRRNIDLTFGARMDYFSNFGGVLTPKIGLTYQPEPSLNFKALVGTAFRVPSFLESFVVQDEKSEPAQNELVVEGVSIAEIGVGYKPFDWLVAEMNYHYTTFYRLAETTALDENDEEAFTLAGSDRIYQNIGGIDVQGVEIELRGESATEIDVGFLPRVIGSSFRINYTYQESEDTETHETEPNMARHKGNIGVGLNLSAQSSKHTMPNMLGLFRSFSDEFSLYMNLFLCDKRERSQDDAREAVPGFALLDATFTAHDIFREGLGLSFSVKNLLNTKYHDPTPEFTLEYPYLNVLDDYPNPGRTFFLELRYAF